MFCKMLDYILVFAGEVGLLIIVVDGCHHHKEDVLKFQKKEQQCFLTLKLGAVIGHQRGLDYHL